MDPNANLQEQERLLAELAGIDAAGNRHLSDSCFAEWRRLRARLRELRQALRGWLDAGGFEPNWAACNRAAAYYGR